MNNESTKETAFIFRRLEDSFPQFMLDLWHSIPLWLLFLALVAVIARIAYGIHYRSTHPHAKKNAIVLALGWTALAVVGTFFLWLLIAFYFHDTQQTKGPTFGDYWNSILWFGFTASIFLAGALFAILMYVADMRSIRWYWALLLASLRIGVYAILCFVFLLPALQTKEKVSKNSRVIVLVDITPSLTRVTDEIDTHGRKPKTRMEQLIEFLSDDNIKLIQNIVNDNPVMVYAFGTRLDVAPLVIERGSSPWGKEEWQSFVRYDFRPFLLKGLSEEGKEALRNSNDWSETGSVDWAATWFTRRNDDKFVNGMSDPDTQVLKDNIGKLERRIEVARTIAQGTNVPDSITAALNRESTNMVEGIIVFSDGRSNLGSESSYRELKSRAQSEKEKIPIFTIAIGEDRQTSSIAITDVQADDVMSPDESSKVVVEADGVNLAGKTVDVELDVFYFGKDAKNVDLKATVPDFTFNADASPTKTPYQITFAVGDPPHGQVEFVIDPAKLAAMPQAKKLTEESTGTAIKKPVLKEGKWAVRARIKKHENEAFPEPEHVRERTGINVQRKKLRTLLVAGAPSREFQFLRNFFVREVLENRAEVTVLIQNAAGTSGLLTPNPTEQIIARFPTKLDLSGKIIDPKEKQYNLNEYDLIVAFDPDWTEVSQQQAEDLQSWVERQGGGLIYVADRINTYQLARVEPNSRLSPLLEVLPVVPDDVIAVKIKAVSRTPRRLYLKPYDKSVLPSFTRVPTYEGPLPDSDLLKLDDGEGKKVAVDDPIAGWERFFTDRDNYTSNPDTKVELYPHRGFYSCYPVKEVKPGAKVLAEFADLDDQGARLHPYIVLNSPSAAWRTCFVGSGELYRMYAYDKDYYERYWAKLMKYMAAKRNVKAARGRVLVGKEVISGTTIRVQAQLLNTNSKPYPKDGPGKIEPKFTIRQVLPTGESRDVGNGPFEFKPSEYDGYYKGQVHADAKHFPPGDFEYTVVVEVPDSASETLKGNFQVLHSDPEMDNTKPDLAAMQTMASDFDEKFQSRLKSDDSRAKLLTGLPKESGVSKLAFRLSDPDLIRYIPEFFASKTTHTDIKGPKHDLWDEGIDTFVPGWQPQTKVVSWVMLVVVFLLCMEWIARKLLRLA